MPSPKETSVPTLREEASATTSLAGNARSTRTFNISRPTLPVAPTTATLYDIAFNPFHDRWAKRPRLWVSITARWRGGKVAENACGLFAHRPAEPLRHAPGRGFRLRG